QNQANKVPNQVPTKKDTLLQLECSTHDYGTRELQAIINKSKEKIVRTNGTTHLIKRENSMNIEMSEKEEEENKKSHSTKSQLQIKQRMHREQIVQQTKAIADKNLLQQLHCRIYQKTLKHKKSEDAYTLMAKLQYWITKELGITRRHASKFNTKIK
ncbi:41361_t:CDS:2, partial [Gigaspora margarita]